MKITKILKTILPFSFLPSILFPLLICSCGNGSNKTNFEFKVNGVVAIIDENNTITCDTLKSNDNMLSFDEKMDVTLIQINNISIAEYKDPSSDFYFNSNTNTFTFKAEMSIYEPNSGFTLTYESISYFFKFIPNDLVTFSINKNEENINLFFENDKALIYDFINNEYYSLAIGNYYLVLNINGDISYYNFEDNFSKVDPNCSFEPVSIDGNDMYILMHSSKIGKFEQCSFELLDENFNSIKTFNKIVPTSNNRATESYNEILDGHSFILIDDEFTNVSEESYHYVQCCISYSSDNKKNGYYFQEVIETKDTEPQIIYEWDSLNEDNSRLMTNLLNDEFYAFLGDNTINDSFHGNSICRYINAEGNVKFLVNSRHLSTFFQIDGASISTENTNNKNIIDWAISGLSYEDITKDLDPESKKEIDQKVIFIENIDSTINMRYEHDININSFDKTNNKLYLSVFNNKYNGNNPYSEEYNDLTSSRINFCVNLDPVVTSEDLPSIEIDSIEEIKPYRIDDNNEHISSLSGFLGNTQLYSRDVDGKYDSYIFGWGGTYAKCEANDNHIDSNVVLSETDLDGKSLVSISFHEYSNLSKGYKQFKIPK